jgi:hypothetical protein
VKDENDDLLADSHKILKGWKHFFSQLLNVKLARNSLEVTETARNLSEYYVPVRDSNKIKLGLLPARFLIFNLYAFFYFVKSELI